MSINIPSKDQHPIDRLIAVMAALRNPNGGCPWDLEQDFASIAPYTVEEAYEVADAIDRGDMKGLREELGDLLLQPVYHAQMAKEGAHFDIYEVIQDITEKMISRHPHVFGDMDAASAEDVNAIWDERKKAEKEGASNNESSALDGVTKALPALLRAEKLQNKAAKVGFEWDDPSKVLDKLEEEIAEMREALATGGAAEKMDELGDLIFLLVNMGRMLGVSAEEATRQCSQKFESRFRGLEKELKAKYQSLNEASLEEMEAAWRLQKEKERG